MKSFRFKVFSFVVSLKKYPRQSKKLLNNYLSAHPVKSSFLPIKTGSIVRTKGKSILYLSIRAQSPSPFLPGRRPFSHSVRASPRWPASFPSCAAYANHPSPRHTTSYVPPAMYALSASPPPGASTSLPRQRAARDAAPGIQLQVLCRLPRPPPRSKLVASCSRPIEAIPSPVDPPPAGQA